MRKNLIDSILQTVPKCQNDDYPPSFMPQDQLQENKQTPHRSQSLQSSTMTSNNTSGSGAAPNHSKIPTPSSYVLSRTNSNFSTTSSCNRAERSSTLSTTSVSSNKSQIAKSQLDYKQLIAKVSSSGYTTPIRSFQRATISSAVKTRIYDQNPQLLSYQNQQDSGPQSLTNSQNPSPSTTPIHFPRSRSFRMSTGYKRSPAYLSKTNRTPENHSFISSDNSMNGSQAIVRLLEENRDLRENIDFLQCEMNVMNENIKNERIKYKREIDELIAAKVRAESILTRKEIELNDARLKLQQIQDELGDKTPTTTPIRSSAPENNIALKEMSTSPNEELSLILIDKLKL